jgi:hypothetical protein
MTISSTGYILEINYNRVLALEIIWPLVFVPHSEKKIMCLKKLWVQIISELSVFLSSSLLSKKIFLIPASLSGK